MVLKADLAGRQRPLQEEPEGQLRQLRLDQGADGVVGKREENLCSL